MVPVLFDGLKAVFYLLSALAWGPAGQGLYCLYKLHHLLRRAQQEERESLQEQQSLLRGGVGGLTISLFLFSLLCCIGLLISVRVATMVTFILLYLIGTPMYFFIHIVTRQGK
jgi:hypothetical protein